MLLTLYSLMGVVNTSAVQHGPLSDTKVLAIHTQRILACNDLQYADLSLMLACTQLEIYLHNQHQVNRMLPQSERCLSIAWSVGIMVLLDLKIS